MWQDMLHASQSVTPEQFFPTLCDSADAVTHVSRSTFALVPKKQVEVFTNLACSLTQIGRLGSRCLTALAGSMYDDFHSDIREETVI